MVHQAAVAVLLTAVAIYTPRWHPLHVAARTQVGISSDYTIVDSISSDYATTSPSDHPCTLKPCQHEGTCIPNGFSFICDCPDGFSGDFCQQPSANPNPVFGQPPNYPKSVSEAAQIVQVVNVEPPPEALNVTSSPAPPTGVPVEEPNAFPVSPRALVPEAAGNGSNNDK